MVIHFLTNQMQIKFNSIKKKIEIRCDKFLVNLGPYVGEECVLQFLKASVRPTIMERF